MQTWWLPVDNRRQQATQALSKTDQNLKHIVSSACRPRVFRIAHLKGFPNIPHIKPPLRDAQQAQIRQQWHRPRKTLLVGRNVSVPERYTNTLHGLQGAVQHPPIVQTASNGLGASFPEPLLPWQGVPRAHLLVTALGAPFPYCPLNPACASALYTTMLIIPIPNDSANQIPELQCQIKFHNWGKLGKYATSVCLPPARLLASCRSTELEAWWDCCGIAVPGHCSQKSAGARGAYLSHPTKMSHYINCQITLT